MTAPPPVLLVHGFATNAARTWGETGWLDLLHDEGRTTIAPDLLGHGDAAQPTDPVAYDRLEELVLAELTDQVVDAVGFSLGARTVLVLAATHPGRFRRLVVAGVGANLFGASRPEPGAVAGPGGSGEGGPPDGPDDPDDPVARHFAALAESARCDPRALAALIARPNPPPLTRDMLRGIEVPVLVVLGDRDHVGPADPLVEALPDAQLVTLRGVDHFATPRSMAFLDAALRFLG